MSSRLERRTYGRATDARAMQELASRMWHVGRHPGGLGWELATEQLADDLVLFEDRAGLAGWAGVEQPGHLVAQVDPDRPAVVKGAIDWCLEVARGDELTIQIFDGDAALRDAIESAGFAPRTEVRQGVGMRRDARAERPVLPDGYVVRSVDASELSARAEAHRSAWRPSSLPWNADHRPESATDPDATSGFTDAVYERVRGTWLYDMNLDLVAVAPDGSFAACCIAWLDPTTGVAEIEPLGVDQSHRRKGLAGALCHEAVARVASAGGREVFINNGPNDAYPAPAGAYAKAGFEVVVRSRPYVLRRRAP